MRAVLVAWLALAACASRGPPVQSANEDSPPPRRERLAPEKLDEHIESAWRKRGLEPAPAASETEFFRRVTLDLVGRIPRPAEVDRMLDGAPRGRLVQELLESEAHARYWAEVLLDRWIPSSRRHGSLASTAIGEWLAREIRGGTPYDEIVSRLVSAEGDVRRDGAPWLIAAGYRQDKREGIAANVAKAFLDVDVACARCHNHPFDDRYTQHDFYALAAYFARTRVENRGPPQRTTIVTDVATGEMRVRLYGEASPRVVAPSLFGRPTPTRPGESRRATLARAIVTSERFAEVAVDQVWRQLFGRPLGEELSGLRATLARDFAARGFDLSHLLRTLVESTAYRRSSALSTAARTHRQTLEETFACSTVRPLSPRQLVESWVLATGLEVSAVGQDKLAAEWRGVRGGHSESGVSLNEALLTWNAPVINRGTLARDGRRLARILDAHRERSDRLEALYRTALARRPTPAEISRDSEFLAAHLDGVAAWEDLFAVILKSSEFTTNH